MGNGEKCLYTPEQIYGKNNFDGERDICGLEVHARNELNLFMKRLLEEDAREGKPTDPEMYEMQELMHDSVMHIIKAFCDCDFSGGVVSYALSLFNRLVNWDPINPITSDPNEWNVCTRDELRGYTTYQAKRCSHLFRDSDDPENMAHDINGYVFDTDFHGSYTTGGGARKKEIPSIGFLEDLLETPIVSRKDIELPEIKFETTRVHLDEFQYQMREELMVLYEMIQEATEKMPPKEHRDVSIRALHEFAYRKIANRIIVVDERYVCFVRTGIRADENRNTLYSFDNADVIAVADWGGYYDWITDHENESPFTQYFNRLLAPYTDDDCGKDSRSVKMLPMISFVSYASDDHAPTHVIPLMMPKKNFRYYSTVIPGLQKKLINLGLDDIAENRYAEYHINLFSFNDNSDMIMAYTKKDPDGNPICDDHGYAMIDPEKTVVLIPRVKNVDGSARYVYTKETPLMVPKDEFELWANTILTPTIASADNLNSDIRLEIRRRFYERYPDKPQYIESCDGTCHCCGDCESCDG